MERPWSSAPGYTDVTPPPKSINVPDCDPPYGTIAMIVIRAFIISLLLIAAEILHGIARSVLLVPGVGEFRSNQIGVFTGSLIILGIQPCLGPSAA